jgi:hypothetical protein
MNYTGTNCTHIGENLNCKICHPMTQPTWGERFDKMGMEHEIMLCATSGDFSKVEYLLKHSLLDIKAFITTIESEAVARGRREMAEEVSEGVQALKKQCFDKDGKGYFTEGWRWTDMGYDKVLALLARLSDKQKNV